MVRKTYHRIIIGLGICVGSLLILFWRWCSPTVEIHNESGGPLKQICVDYSGGSSVVNDLPNGGSAFIRITPRGESSLSICCSHSDGTVRHRRLDCYFEDGYGYRIEVRVMPKGEILSRTRFGPFPDKHGRWLQAAPIPAVPVVPRRGPSERRSGGSERSKDEKP